MSRRDELARIAYQEVARASLAAGITPPQWDALEPAQREMYAAAAEAVARAERERIRELSVRLNATYLKWINGGPERQQWTFADLLKDSGGDS